jgi:E3 ubiquitin-protein ligase synoviolin
MISLKGALLVASVAMAASAMKLWMRVPHFYEFCVALQVEAMPRFLFMCFGTLLCAAALQLTFAWAGGPLTDAEFQRVFTKLKSMTMTLIFEFAVMNFQGSSSLLFFVIVLLSGYIANYFNQKIVAFSTAADLPTPRRHQRLFFAQLVACVAMVYMMALSWRFLPLYALFRVLGALITSTISILLDIIRHVTFLFDHEELGASVDAYRVIFVAECAASVLESVITLCFLVCMLLTRMLSYYYLRSFYDSAVKLPATLEKWRIWVRMRRLIEQLPEGTAEDLAREDMCIVCRVQMQLGDGRRLPCGHCFHPDCIERWVGQQTQCPVCQCDLRAVLAEAERKLAEEENQQKTPAPETKTYNFEDLLREVQK